jgi:diguanylate cyclase (GGDEF)-like protein
LAAALAVAAGLAFLTGYAGALLPSGPVPVDSPSAANPVAAIAIILLAVAALARPDSHPAWRIAAQAAISITIALILFQSYNVFRGAGIVDISAQGSLLTLALGQLLLLHRRARAGQVLGFAAAIGFLLDTAGYVTLLPAFQQPAALLLGLAGLAAVAVVALSSAGAGFLHELTGGTHYGSVVRTVLAASTLGALLLGWSLDRFAAPKDCALPLVEALIVIVWIWVMVTAAAIRINRIDGQLRLAEARLLRGAMLDGLTGLFNRNKMDELIEAQRRAPDRAALIMIDLDRFRSVNNALGTDQGDALLLQVAKRLSNLAAPHRVARAGGDEFAIFCAAVGAAEANRLGQAVVETIAVPFIVRDGRQFHMTASVGVAHGATDGVEDLRDAADEAMYLAKTQGGHQSVAFVSALHQARLDRIGLEQDLYRALNSSSELFLVYQPIISLRDRRLVAIEALARWQHPRLGLVGPGRFVAIAEAAGMYLCLGRKLRELAVAQAARWRDAGFGPLPVINLNVSPLELVRSDVAGTLGALIDRHGLQRSAFCLEVTEGSFADERALDALRAARAAGFKIAMDDFGVGYSSLAQLPRLPLTAVKLDRSFLNEATGSEHGISLLATMVQLAHVLKLPVVAEGVETTAELNIVSDCGCDSVQGFIFSPPLSPIQLEAWLRGDRGAQPRPPLARPALTRQAAPHLAAD